MKSIASVLAKQFPTLDLRLPPKRKIWQSEDYRMSIFDAAAAGVAYFEKSTAAHCAEFDTQVDCSEIS